MTTDIRIKKLVKRKGFSPAIHPVYFPSPMKYLFKTFKTSLGIVYTVFSLCRAKKSGGKIAGVIKQISNIMTVTSLVEDNQAVFDTLMSQADFTLGLHCLGGKLNETLGDVLFTMYGKPGFFTIKRSDDAARAGYLATLESLKHLMTKEELPKLERLTNYLQSPSSLGLLIHQMTWKLREIGIADQIFIQRIQQDIIDACTKYKDTYGRKPVVFVYDDSVSENALSTRMVVNQLSPYANVIVFCFLQEF